MTTQPEADPEPIEPKNLTEHQLLEKIYESFLVLIKSTNDLRKEQKVVLNTKRFTSVIVGILLVLVIALQVQIQTRNTRLDQFNDKLTELRVSVRKIEAVADRVQEGQDPEQAAAVKHLFEQVDKICDAVDCQP